MSCENELANEWARCSRKNTSYITKYIPSSPTLSSTPWALDILNVQLLKSTAAFLWGDPDPDHPKGTQPSSPWWWCWNVPTLWTHMGKISCGKEHEIPLNTCFPSHIFIKLPTIILPLISNLYSLGCNNNQTLRVCTDLCMSLFDQCISLKKTHF